MRLPALVTLLGACHLGPVSGATCFEDEDCIRGEICARDGVCWPTPDVRPVKTTWTIRGVAATRASCASHPELFIRFEGDGDPLQYSPVPCEIGQHFMDKLPPYLTRIELGDAFSPDRASAEIDGAPEVAFDLSF